MNNASVGSHKSTQSARKKSTTKSTLRVEFVQEISKKINQNSTCDPTSDDQVLIP